MAEKIVSLHAFYASGKAGVNAYLSRPTASGTWPAVIILHEWWGLEEHFRDLGRRLAKEGFVALVPDLYHGKVTADPREAARLKTSLDIEGAIQETLDAVPYLRGLPFVSGKIGITGFCMGGGLALLAACRGNEFSAAVTYFPSIYPDPSEVANAGCPLLIHHGMADSITPMSEIERIKNTLEQHRKPVELFLYDGADHAFVNDTHERYHKEAAEASWPRTIEFFRRHLRNE